MSISPEQDTHDPIKALMENAIEILSAVGIPTKSLTQKQLERMAMSLIALSGVNTHWPEASMLRGPHFLRTRDLISILNQRFNANISLATYDVVRRVTLKPLTVSGLVINSGELEGLATNAPNRGYALDPSFRALISQFGTPAWEAALQRFMEHRAALSEVLERKRTMQAMEVRLPQGQSISLGPGKHNLLQKAIIEEFLPRYGYNCNVLYIGDTTRKHLLVDQKLLSELGVFEIDHDKLPDIIAYSPSKNWLFLIEAVHSSGPVSEFRLIELKQRLAQCKAGLVFVTAFLSRKDFRNWVADIAWETEVWVADAPDHLIHFNGGRFLGPY